MANPIMYVNNNMSNLQVGSYVIPAQNVFTYDWDDYKLTIGGSGINRVVGTVSTGAMNTHLSNGTIEVMFSANNSIGAVGDQGVGGIDGDTGEVYAGYASLVGYEMKLRRPAQVFYGTQYKFTLPAESNIIVGGLGYVGVTYRQRLAITGCRASLYQQSQIKGEFPRNWHTIYELHGDQEWWVDTGAGVDGYDTKYTTAIAVS